MLCGMNTNSPLWN